MSHLYIWDGTLLGQQTVPFESLYVVLRLIEFNYVFDK